jgi:hypothetical protein
LTLALMMHHSTASLRALHENEMRRVKIGSRWRKT